MSDAAPSSPDEAPVAASPLEASKVLPAAKGGWAARLKAWGEAASSLLKAILLGLAVLAVGIVAGTAIWRDQRTHHVDVVIDPETVKALRALGSEIDLRQAFIDALNDRIRGVQEIVRLNYSQLIDTRSADAVSFKPFGLDATTSQLTGMVREVLSSEPPATVRVELLCTPLPCSEARTNSASLLVTVTTGSSSQRVAIALRPTASGFNRSLRGAMQRSAEALLERAEPMIASIYYLNITAQRSFPEQSFRDMQRAAGMALRVRDADGAVSCVGNLVIGSSLFWRGAWEDGLAIEQRAGESKDPVCQVHAATNVVLMLSPYVCNSERSIREASLANAQAAYARVSKRGRSGLNDLVYERIPSAELILTGMQTLLKVGNEPARVAFCSQQRVTAFVAGNSITKDTLAMIDLMTKRLPPKASQKSPKSILEMLVALQEAGIAREDAVARYATALATSRIIDRYLPTDLHPRKLFMLRGRLAMNMASAAHDVLLLAPAARLAALKAVGVDTTIKGFDADAVLWQELYKRVTEARLDFENALASDTAASLVEASSDIEPLTQLGDALLVAGNVAGARDAYARAVDAFVDLDAPINQIFRLADAVSHVGALHIASGGCRAAAAIAQPDPRWSRAGFALTDLCTLSRSDVTTRVPALLQVIRPLVSPAITRCAIHAAPASATSSASSSAASLQFGGFAMLECLRSSGVNDPAIRIPFASSAGGVATNAAIEQALAGSR